MLKREILIPWVFGSFFLGISTFQTSFLLFVLVCFIYLARSISPFGTSWSVRVSRQFRDLALSWWRWSPPAACLWLFLIFNAFRVQLVYPQWPEFGFSWTFIGIWSFCFLSLEKVDFLKIYRFMLLLSIPGLIYSLYWLAQPAEIEWSLEIGFHSYPRASGFLSNPITFAAGMLVLLCWSMARLEANVGARERFWIWSHTGLVVLILVLSRIRSGLLAFALIFAIHALRNRANRGMILGFILLLFLATGCAFWFFGFNWASIEERLDLMRQGWLIFREYPLLGIGSKHYSHFPLPESGFTGHPHNVWLGMAAEGGLVGLTLWSCYLLSLSRRALCDSPAHGNWALTAVRYCLLSFVLYGLFDHNFGDSELLLIHALNASLLLALTREAPSCANPSAAPQG